MYQKQFRHEFKYYINYREYELLRRRLAIVLKPDPYADEKGNYHIRSLYFEDIHNTSLFEKQSGTLVRKKYRIRIYNIEDSIIKLEKKSRIGQFIHKTSVSLTKEQYHKIIANDITFMKESQNPLLVEFYFDIIAFKYKPNVIVDYVREAYIWDINNIRITFDKALRTGLYSTDIFNKDLLTVDVLEEPKMILEIKYDHFLPDFIRNIIQINTSQRWAISKYVICKKFTKLNTWEDN
ncbi:MAG: polyphosphate polymerase domain-containing protein [Sulfurovum sp.]|nr:polyphosphate polymerase domain-containing protein [Sulfurovum sp.]